MKHENERLVQDKEELRGINDNLIRTFTKLSTIIQLLRASSDDGAAMTLARLRLGESLDAILHCQILTVSSQLFALC